MNTGRSDLNTTLVVLLADKFALMGPRFSAIAEPGEWVLCLAATQPILSLTRAPLYAAIGALPAAPLSPLEFKEACVKPLVFYL
jgi:hypothetical protein